MAVYKAPIADMQFILNDVFKADTVWSGMEGTQEVSMDLASAILEEAAKLCEGLLFPLNRSGDEEGCAWNEGVVTTPEGFKEAFKTYSENGWTALNGDPQYGGQGMPKMLTVLFDEMLNAANSSFALYPMLTNGSTLAIAAHANEELKQKYLPKLYDGTWCGTMCLTEPHSGTDLGLIKTKAIPQDNGAYKISGTKIFITGGEHDFSENIIHLVLAKLPDAPAGSKGISLFLVPRNKVDANDVVGENNGVSCGSIEHKMGIKGSATCVMNFDDAEGWLVGEINEGLACMFTMMNYERLSIGIQGLGLGEVSYQNALEYARDRVQGRAATGAVQPEKTADPIIVHPDVRKMLLTQKCYNEAGRAFAIYIGMHLDIAKYSIDAEQRKASANRVALLTPVAKAFFSDKGFESCVHGQQVYGGHGYIREWGMEQYVRDARIAQIYEGTNGVQALDLMGRKVARNDGAFVSEFLAEVKTFADAISEGASEYKETLLSAIATLQKNTDWVVAESKQDPNAVGASSVDYLEMFGFVAYAYMWSLMLENMSAQDATFQQQKQQTAKFFFQRMLPKIDALEKQIQAGSSAMMDLDADLF